MTTNSATLMLTGEASGRRRRQRLRAPAPDADPPRSAQVN